MTAEPRTATADAGSLLARLRRFLRGPALVYLAAAVIARLGGFALIPLYTRRLTKAEYGDFALAQSAIALLPTLFTIGLVTAVPRFYFAGEDRARGRERAGAVARWVSLFGIATAAACVAVIALFAPAGSQLFARTNLTLIVVTSVGSAIAMVPDVMFRAEQRPYRAAAYQLGGFFLQIGLAWWFVVRLGWGLTGAVTAYALTYVAMGAVAFAVIVRYLGGRLDRAILREALPFSLPFLPHVLAQWAQLAADRWVLKAYGLDAALGGYALAIQLASPVTVVVAAWNDAESARMGETVRSKTAAVLGALAKPTARRYFLVALPAAAAILVAIPVVRLVIGAKFGEALVILPVLLAVTVVDAMYFPATNIVYYASRTRVIPIVTVSASVLAVVLGVLLVPRWAVTGAIVARVASSVVRTLGMWIAARVVMRELARAKP